MVAYSYIFIFITLAFGYFCLKFLHFTKYRITKYSGQELFFSSAFAGLAIFATGFLLCQIPNSSLSSIVDKLSNIVNDRGIFYVIAGLVLALPSILVANFFYSNDDSIAKFIEEQNDGFERLLQTSQKYLKPLIITLSTEKVYIGVVFQSFFSPIENKSFLIMPLYSGYREENSKELIITNEYVEILNKYKSLDADKLNDFKVSLPVDSIVSMSVFNVDIYQEMNKEE